MSKYTFVPSYNGGGGGGESGTALFSCVAALAIPFGLLFASYKVRVKLVLNNKIMYIQYQGEHAFNHRIQHYNVELLQNKGYSIGIINKKFQANTLNAFGYARIKDMNAFKNDCKNYNVYTSLTYSKESIFGFIYENEEIIKWEDIEQLE